MVQEDTPFGGWGAEIVSLIVEKIFDYLDAPPKRVAPTPVPFAPIMEKYYVPDEEDIIRAVREVIS